jgi:DNA-binding MarR family transcriptional regulator
MNPPASNKLDDIDRGLREVFRLHKILLSDFRPESDILHLNRTHWRTLMYIMDSGPDCMKGICRHIGLEAGSFTPVADRLIEEGLLVRYPDPGDRRRMLLRITDSGEAAGRQMREKMKDHFSSRLSVLDDTEIGKLASALNTIRNINHQLQGTKHE